MRPCVRLVAVLLVTLAAAASLPAGVGNAQQSKSPQSASAEAWHGLEVTTVTPELMTEHSLAVPFGAMVSAVEPESPAAAAGLARRDVIVTVGNERVLTAIDLTTALGKLRAGSTADLGVLSPGRATRKVAVVLRARPGPAGPVERGYIGVNIENLSEERARALGLSRASGVRVTSPVPGGPAERAGLREGDIVVELNGEPIRSTDAFIAAVGSIRPGASARLTLLRGGLRQTIVVPLERRPAALDDPKLPDPVLMLDTGGHMAQINQVVFTHDGRHIVSSSDDKVIRVWEWRAGRTVRTFRGDLGPGFDGMVFALALSPHDASVAEGHRWLASAGYVKGDDNDIRLYDFASGRLVRLLKGHNNVVLGLAFAPDGRTLISGGPDKTAIIWDVDTGRQLHRLRGHDSDIKAVSFSNDGRRAITGSNDRTVRIWDVWSGKLLATSEGHKDRVNTITVNRHDGMIASGSDDGEIRLWDGTSGRLIKVLTDQKNSVGALSFTPDGKRLLSTCTQNCKSEWAAYVWDIATGKEIVRYAVHDNIVLGAGISPDGRIAATGGGDNAEVHVWDLDTGDRRVDSGGRALRLAGSGLRVWAAGFSADGGEIAWGNTWERNTPASRGPFELRLRLPTATERLGAPRPVTPAETSRAHMWRRAIIQSGNLSLAHRASTGAHARPDGTLEIKRDGKVIGSVTRGPTDGYRHRAYTFTPDNQTVVSGGANGVVISYDLDGKKRHTFVGHEGEVWAVATSPDGRLLVTGSSDQTVKLWNLATGQIVASIYRGSDGEWVMWTPQGYYTGSQRAGDLVGWVQSYGADREARYVTGGRLRHMLRRPDIVERAIVLADAAEAVKELAAGGPTLAELVRRPPPDLWLKGDDTTATGRARLVLEVERTGRPVRAFDVHLGSMDANTGLFVPERRLVHRTIRIPTDYKPQFPDRELVAFEIDLREGSNLVAVVARTDVGETTTVPTQVISRADALGGQDGVLRILAIGVDRYPDATPYPGHLTFAGKDARDFAETARRTMGLRHHGVEVELLTNGAGGNREPTKANIEAALRRLSRAGPKDTVVLFIAGHGESRRGQYVVLPTDHRRARADEAGENVVEWRTIREALASAPGRRLVFLDTCHAGNAYNDALSGDVKSFAFTAFTAAQQGAIAQEDRTLEQGRFTHAVRLGLQGEAMRNNAIEVYDLGPYISRKVRELSKGAQEAEFFPGAGNFVLVRQ